MATVETSKLLEVAQRIREMREIFGFTIEEMAENLFVTIISALSVISNLSDKAVVSDTPSTTKYEYYRSC